MGGISKLWLLNMMQQVAEYSKNQQSDKHTHICLDTKEASVCRNRTHRSLCFDLWTSVIHLSVCLSLSHTHTVPLPLSSISHFVPQSVWLSSTSAANST